MAHAEKCPICGGEGMKPTEAEDEFAGDSRVKCWGCTGKGWVEVADDPIPSLPPYYPPYYPSPQYPPMNPGWPIGPGWPGYLQGPMCGGNNA